MDINSIINQQSKAILNLIKQQESIMESITLIAGELSCPTVAIDLVSQTKFDEAPNRSQIDALLDKVNWLMEQIKIKRKLNHDTIGDIAAKEVHKHFDEASELSIQMDSKLSRMEQVSNQFNNFISNGNALMSNILSMYRDCGESLVNNLNQKIEDSAKKAKRVCDSYEHRFADVEEKIVNMYNVFGGIEKMKEYFSLQHDKVLDAIDKVNAELVAVTCNNGENIHQLHSEIKDMVKLIEPGLSEMDNKVNCVVKEVEKKLNTFRINSAVDKSSFRTQTTAVGRNL